MVEAYVFMLAQGPVYYVYFLLWCSTQNFELAIAQYYAHVKICA